MYRVIMLPTAGEPELERPAITLAVRLARKLNAELRLVRVESAPVALNISVTKNPLTITERDWREARMERLQKLEALGEQCRALGGIRVVTDLEDGIVNSTLLSYAKSRNVDVVVMSSHLRGGVQRATLGSTADYLIRNSEIPVLIAKPSLFQTEEPDRTVGRILVALDGSELAEQIIPHVVTLATGVGAEVSLLRVLTPQTYAQQRIMQPGLPWWDADIAEAESYLDGVADKLRGQGISVAKDVILSDDVAAGILDYSARVNADLLAIATSGAGGFKRLVFGSVADEVARKAPASLLIFHAVDRALKSDVPRMEEHKPTAVV